MKTLPHCTYGSALIAVACAWGCTRHAADEQAPAPAPASAAPDRLSGQEALPGRELVFGIEVPSSMRVSSRFDDVVHLTGSRTVRDLVTYFSKHVSVANVELLPEGAVFARARVNDDARQRVYRIDISQRGPISHVKISDVTAPPTIQGLSEAQRWERAGLNADGTLKDRLKQF